MPDPKPSWACAGRPPHEPPCGAEGTTQASANRHVDQTRHAVVTSTSGGVLERVSAA